VNHVPTVSKLLLVSRLGADCLLDDWRYWPGESYSILQGQLHLQVGLFGRLRYLHLLMTSRNPRDAALELVSRTVGSDRIVDEFIFHLTHDTPVDWLLPGVAPTDKKLAIPMVAVVNIRGDRLAHGLLRCDMCTHL
jgi:hypothetical protein